jgi:hypothetical protein
MGTQKTPNSQSNPEQNSNAGGITIPDFKLYCRVVVTKTVWLLAQNTHVEQWNKLKIQK